MLYDLLLTVLAVLLTDDPDTLNAGPQVEPLD
jgi:hypothetical protein